MTLELKLRLIVVLGAFVFLGHASTTAPSQVNAADLERGSTEKRLQVLVEILDIAPNQRDAKIWPAITREATRMLAFRRRRSPVTDNERELSYAYAAGLIRALGESHNRRSFRC